MIGYGKDNEYARTRLLETIVMFNGEPVWVKAIGRNGLVAIAYVSDLREGECRIDQLDINPVKLGYVNSHNTAIYYTRAPVRRDWRQGLRASTMRTNMGRNIPVAWDKLAYTIKGKYPSVDEAIRDVKNRKTQATAFSRNFSIKQDNALEYKGRWIVGAIIDRMNYILAPKFEWVRESLEEELLA